MANQFCPAGFEDDSDDDGFMFGDDPDPDSDSNSKPSNSKSNPNSQSQPNFWKPHPVNHENDNDKRHKGGFGATISLNTKKKSNASNRTPSVATASTRKNKSWNDSDTIPTDDYRMAVIRNNIDTVRELLDQGLAVDTVFSTQWTALMYAAQNSQADIVKLLLHRGADPNFNKDMYTVLMAACSSTCDKELDILNCVNILLESGAEVNSYDRYHMTPIMYAVRKQRLTVVKRLIEADALLDRQDNRGYTVLMFAASQGHLRILKLLLEAGADPQKLSCHGTTAADLAAEQGHSKISEVLKTNNDSSKLDQLETLAQACQNEASSERPTTERIQQGSSQEVIKYGDLELFLSGLELADLIPTIHKHKIMFQDLLRMTDKDLQGLGINQMGVRKRILDATQAIHKKSWEKTSVSPVQYNKKITCADAVAMVTNTKQHVIYISSSIGYISDQLKSDKEILVNAQESAGSEELSIQTEEAVTNVKFLFEELSQLRHHLTQVANRPEYRPPDLIEPRQLAKSSHSSFNFFLAGATICGIVYYKFDWISEHLQKVYSKTLS